MEERLSFQLTEPEAQFILASMLVTSCTLMGSAPLAMSALETAKGAAANIPDGPEGLRARFINACTVGFQKAAAAEKAVEQTFGPRRG